MPQSAKFTSLIVIKYFVLIRFQNGSSPLFGNQRSLDFV
jgi:hypothetical protein